MVAALRSSSSGSSFTALVSLPQNLIGEDGGLCGVLEGRFWRLWVGAVHGRGVPKEGWGGLRLPRVPPRALGGRRSLWMQLIHPLMGP